MGILGLTQDESGAALEELPVTSKVAIRSSLADTRGSNRRLRLRVHSGRREGAPMAGDFVSICSATANTTR
jgi:hypothetical protein